MAKSLDDKGKGRHTVFISYASADRSVAGDLARALTDAGLSVWWDQNIKIGDNWQKAISTALRANDYVLVLYSDAARRVTHASREILPANTVRELSDRAITVIPITLDSTPLPEALSSLQHIDFSTDFHTAIVSLVTQLSAAPEVDFSKLSGEAFEAMVGELLEALGFEVKPGYNFNGTQFDFLATRRTVDPFGRDQTETWIFELKNYRYQRPSASVIRALIGTLNFLPRDFRPAFITSSQLTSAARHLVDSSASNIRLIEGVELRRILLSYPHITAKYFGSGRP